LYQELLQSLDCNCSKPFIQDRKKLTAIRPSILKNDSAIFIYSSPKGEKINLKIVKGKQIDSSIDVFEMNRNETAIKYDAAKDLRNIDLNFSELYLSKNQKNLFLYLKSTKDNYALKLIFDQKKYITQFRTSNKTVNQFDFLDGTAQ
jgi:ribosome biogenesis protein Nip4